ncbi:Solute carrier family 46 member 3 [Nymphon striatum]|nr:Solute carrier family 46 member 3 [Nymphon striatum]
MESEKGIKSSGFPSRIWGYLTLITVEPMLFFYAMGMAMNDVTATNLMEIKICYFVKEFPACVCEHFLTDESLKMQKELVQKSLTNYNTILSVMGIPSVLWCMVIGEWSDNYGRKKPILGAILSFLLTTVGFFMSLSYIGDITTAETRTSRIALCSGLSFLGYPMGTLLGGFLFHSFHFKGTYSASIVAMSISLVYGYIRIKETRGLDNSASLKVIARDLFRISNFLEGLKTIRKKREGSKRLVLSLCLVIICLNNAFLIGTSSIQYPYTQLTFQWNVEQFSIFSATGQFFNKFVNIFITPLLSTRFHLPESAIGLIGVMSGIIAMITKVLARNVPLYYISEFLFGMFFVGTAAARSLLSQSVNGDELGKAYGFAGALEAVSTLVFIPAIQQIYKATLSFFPSFTFVVTALVTLPNLCSFLWLDMSKRRTDLRPKTEDSGERIHTIALPDDIDITAPDFPKSEKSTYL